MPESNPLSPTFLPDIKDVLGRTPVVIQALLDGIPDSWTSTADTDGGWRPRDVVGHLISAEIDDWMPRLHRILEDGTEKAFDPFDRFAHVERDVNATLDELVDRFAELRAENLTRLDALVSEDDLDRPGRHPELGDVTVRHLLATWAIHDLNHLGQILGGLAGSHDPDVGPWKAYLGILLRRDDPGAVPG